MSSASVRRYVARRKRELGLKGREVFVPQSYQLGVEAQVDFTARFTMPRSRRFWKGTRRRFQICV